jgi:hypothetical protein
MELRIQERGSLPCQHPHWNPNHGQRFFVRAAHKQWARCLGTAQIGHASSDAPLVPGLGCGGAQRREWPLARAHMGGVSRFDVTDSGTLRSQREEGEARKRGRGDKHGEEVMCNVPWITSLDGSIRRNPK